MNIIVICILYCFFIVFIFYIIRLFKYDFQKCILETYENDNKKIIKLKFGSTFYLPENPIKRHQMQNINQITEYFLPSNYIYEVVNNNEKSDLTIWDIYMDNNEHLRDDEINILICVENVDHWNMYPHYTKYNNYNNDKIKIYLYNHIDKLIENDKYIAIPLIHNYINYYTLNKNIIKPSIFTPFNNKKFCLMINKSKLNPDINKLVDQLNKIDKVETLDIYPEIINTSCYHSIELLNVFNKYKFIICFENSYKNGYITEKIFNCFFAHTIPIYKGSPIIQKYINEQAFISADNPSLHNIITETMSNEIIYNNYINADKISNEYNDEDNKKIFSNLLENIN